MRESRVKSLTFYLEYVDLISLLKKDEQSDLILKILNYVFYGQDMTELSTNQMKVWSNLKRPIDKSIKQSMNVSKRYTNEDTNKSTKRDTNLPTKQSTNDSTKRGTHQDVNVYVNGNVLESKIDRGMGKGREKTFTKPTVDEIRAYCQERQNGIDANQFYDFYESKGWLIGKNKMKDWKACIRTWEKSRPKTKIPEWFEKSTEIIPMSDNDQKEMERILEEFK